MALEPSLARRYDHANKQVQNVSAAGIAENELNAQRARLMKQDERYECKHESQEHS